MEPDVALAPVPVGSEPWALEAGLRDLLRALGEDPDRDGLVDTPSRVLRSLQELTGGYRQDPADLFRTFDAGPVDEMIVLRDIPFASLCEHHLLPFTGVATVAYLPGGDVIGVSKLARLVDLYARRLQIQERLTRQVTDALHQYADVRAAACIITAAHTCMTLRGVAKTGSSLVTSSLTGLFREDARARSELLGLSNG